MVASDDNSIITDACHRPGLMLSAYTSLIAFPEQPREVGLSPTFQRRGNWGFERTLDPAH